MIFKDALYLLIFMHPFPAKMRVLSLRPPHETLPSQMWLLRATRKETDRGWHAPKTQQHWLIPFTGNAGMCFQTIFLLQFECVDFGSLAALQWVFHASSHQEVVGVSARWNGGWVIPRINRFLYYLYLGVQYHLSKETYHKISLSLDPQISTIITIN